MRVRNNNHKGLITEMEHLLHKTGLLYGDYTATIGKVNQVIQVIQKIYKSGKLPGKNEHITRY